MPTPAEVASLSREDWEGLCRSICALVHDADGVEDRLGKGNGLDMIRTDPGGVLGWQFRRYDARFGDKQAEKIVDAVRLAVSKCKSEDGLPLKRFTVWANLDLEPGHGKQIGERERFAKLKQEMAEEMGVELVFQGLSWVHAQLLMRPMLRPDLFEDVAAQVDAVSAQVRASTDEIKSLVIAVAGAEKGSAALKRLVEQAGIHFERGKQLGSKEQFGAAVRCLNDALNLLRDLDADPILEGRVHVILAGIQRLLGDLRAAEAAGRAAIAKLIVAPSDDLAHARGNLALVLRDQQRYAESRQLVLQTLDHFENEGNSLEIVRTLTHILELSCNEGNSQAVRRWGARLKPAVANLERDIGITDVSASATGALGNGMLMLAIRENDRDALSAAEKIFILVESASRQNGMKASTVASLSQRASAVRYQDRLPEALALYQEARQEAEAADLAKIAADCIYNEAIVRHEMGDTASAIESMLAARERYHQLGDIESELDAATSAERWSRAMPY